MHQPLGECALLGHWVNKPTLTPEPAGRPLSSGTDMVKMEFLSPWRRARLPQRSRREASHPTLPRVTPMIPEGPGWGGSHPAAYLPPTHQSRWPPLSWRLESCGPFPGQPRAASHACDQGTHLSLHVHSLVKTHPSPPPTAFRLRRSFH